MKFVVIGGDAAGMSAASKAKRHSEDIEVIVFEKTEDVSYSACGMPYNLADPDREIEELVVRHAAVFREKQGIDLRTGHCVKKIDVDRKTVSVERKNGDDLEQSYDKLLIATGASPRLPEIPGIDLPGVMKLKQLKDARKIKNFLRNNTVKKVVILGMGYIAMEMVESLHGLGIEVDMIKPRPDFIPWLETELADAVQNTVEKRGIGLFAGSEPLKIEPVQNRLGVVCNDMRVECDMVLAATGIKPNSELAREAGLALGPWNAIAVDKQLRTSNRDVFSAGDCADAFHVVTGSRVWIPLALRANRAGWAVADNVCGMNTEIPDVAGTAVFRVFDMEVARTGINQTEALEAGFEPAKAVIKSRSRGHAHPGNTTIFVQLVGDRKSGRLLGAQMVGKEGAAHRINAAAVALQAGMTVKDFSRSDLAYAPPFGPTWDPLLTAANQLLKKM